MAEILVERCVGVDVAVVMFFFAAVRRRVVASVRFVRVIMLFTEAMDMPDRLNGNEDGPVPGRTGRLKLADHVIGAVRMRLTSFASRSMHRFHLGPDGKVDTRADHSLAFASKHLPLGEPRRGAGNQRRGGADDRIADEIVAEADRRCPGNAGIGDELGQHVTRHQWQRRRLQEDRGEHELRFRARRADDQIELVGGTRRAEAQRPFLQRHGNAESGGKRHQKHDDQ